MQIPVVIVDDSSTDRYLARRIINKSADGRDIKVVEFETGDDFVETFQDSEKRIETIGESPFLVFLDINMPGMSGFDVLEFLKDHVPSEDQEKVLTVMMYSSSSHAEDQNDAMHYSFVKGYVIKPLTRESCGEILDKYYPES